MSSKTIDYEHNKKKLQFSYSSLINHDGLFNKVISASGCDLKAMIIYMWYEEIGVQLVKS